MAIPYGLVAHNYMSITLSNLKPAPGSRTRVKRLGRGNASGKGTYSGKGIKGQRARSGGRKGLKLLGLKRIFQRVPKHRGFKSIHPKPAQVNLGWLEARFPAGAVISPQTLKAAGLVRNIRNGVKILGDGSLTKTLAIHGCLVSQSAKEKIEKAGGRVESR
ncbi:MAG: 50S ribosomal protein L15 [Parcubacteria group bacterium GW2011_GWC2_45_7]|nr:MAG: 50S ribosomal protein L15 [Parcubacteria group bacterium GW2011_GWC2_45_7]